MTRCLTGALLLCASLAAVACPLCLGAFRQSPAQDLAYLGRAVLAVPAVDGNGYRVVAVIKGEPPPNGMIDEDAYPGGAATVESGKALLLAQDRSWPMWVNLGTVRAEHETLLRELGAGERWTEMNADAWRARAALMVSYLESSDPLVAQIAYRELASAPYDALLAVKPRLDAIAIRRWLADPKLAGRQSLYLLLLGIAGDPRDATGLERRLEAAWKSGDATNLGPLLAADLELRGAARLSWVDARYLRDRERSTPELEAVLLALSVQGNANNVIPRERVIQSYRVFMKEHKAIAGFVAQDLAAWQYWGAVPEYTALMKSDLRQQYASRIAIVAYLKRSPGGAAGVDFK